MTENTMPEEKQICLPEFYEKSLAFLLQVIEAFAL